MNHLSNSQIHVTDYIVFKDGHLKTKKYAILNNIKLVNPLWVDDKINHHIFKDDKEYEIKTNFGDIALWEKYEKNKKEDENMNAQEEISIKNYELELEPEYDREYANKIDKLRENNSLNNKKDNINSYIEIKREKRISIDNKKENRETIMNIKKMNDKCNNQMKVSASRNNNSNKRKMVENTLSKDNQKDKQKKRSKKNKKCKSVDNNISSNKNKIKNSQKNTEKKKKKESNDKNYILEINQNSNNVLGLTTNKDKEKNEIQINSGKINILTYKLGEKEIQCLKEFKIFEYKGNLNTNINNDKKIYNNANIIILEKKNVIYDWKMYDFLLDKKIIIDFAPFLLEFVNIDNINNIDMNTIIEKINNISINNEIYFFNKKMRLQKRTMIQSINIIENILSKDKKEQIAQQQNDIENNFYFMIAQDINENEKKVFQKLLKNYLKANIININLPKNRSRSVANQINMNLDKLLKKNKKNNLEVINENGLDNKENINEDDKKVKIEKSKDIKEMRNNNINLINDRNKAKDIINEEQNLEKTFLISKNKVNNIKYLSKIKYYKGVISYKYIYDSFLNGQLLDLNEKEIFEKYKME